MNIKNTDITELKGESLDIVKQNIQQLKQLFPNVFTEEKIDFDALKSELGEYIETSDERYQFTWAGKEQAKRIAATPTLGTLRPAPEDSVDWDSTENLYIEGDNLEVLKLLQKSYFNQVKMIYIDPPYNTGKDFVYKDDFKDNLANYQRLTGQRDEEGNPLFTNSDSSGRYHSNWLNMMYPRLKLARNLLRNDGVIFISIDDNEVHNLRKICDEIFGEGNFIANVVWQRAFSPKNDAKFISDSHDHILIYGKKLDEYKVGLLPRTKEANARYTNPDNDPRGPWVSGDLSVKTYSAKLDYYITTPSGRVIYPTDGRCWGISEDKFQELVDDNRIWFGEDGNNVPRLKRFLNEVRDGMTPISLWTFNEVGHNQEGRQELKKMFDGKGYFDGPKPLRLLNRIMQVANLSKEDIVMDFFSGSSTTAHAVMQLNAEDDGKRKFIMVQIPEHTPENSETHKAGYNTIAEIGKERIRRAAAKIREEHPDTKADLGFKVFKLDTSNIKKWQPSVETLADDLFAAVENIAQERTPADLLYEVLLKYGLSLTLPVEEIKLGKHTAFNVAMGSLVACFDESITLETVQAIIDLATDDAPILRVVFRDNGFKDDIVKTNAIQRLKQADIEDILSI